MIGSSLGDVPIRVIHSSIDEPRDMILLIDEPYTSNTTVSRIYLLTSLYRMRFTGGSIEQQCNHMAIILSQLEKMGDEVAVREIHKGPLPLVSLGSHSFYEEIIAALRMKKAEELTFEFVSSTLIEKSRTRHSEKKHSNRANRTHSKGNIGTIKKNASIA